MKRKVHTLVLNGGEVDVVIQPSHKEYFVLLQGKRIARLWRVKNNKFMCRHLETGNEFAGETRRKAATSMIYTMYKE